LRGSASPRHDPSPEAEAARADVVDPGVAPRVEEPRQRPALVEAADRRAEEGADLAPPAADDRASRGQADADVQLPEWPPQAARDAELEARERPAGLHDACQLPQRRRRIVD